MNIFDNYDFRTIIAYDKAGNIGLNNALPWKHEALDMKRFRDLTSGHAVLMGRKTWESLPDQYRPLPNRTNIVLTRHPETIEGLGRNDKALTDLVDLKHYVPYGSKLFLIGGLEMYRQFANYSNTIHVTKFNDVFPADTSIDFEFIGYRPKVGTCEYHVSEHGYSFEFLDFCDE